MLGLRIALSVAKGVIDEIGGLLSKLARRSTYSENLADSRAIVSDIDSYDLLDKATILLTPTATSDARVHSVKTYTGDELLDVSSLSGTNWTADGSGGFTNNGSGEGLNGSLNENTIIGATYKFTFDVTISGIANATFGGVTIPVFTTSGSKEYYVIATSSSTSFSFYLAPSGSPSMFVNNISIVDVSSDFDFDRASSATRINSDANVEDITSDLARINYDSNGDNGHILLEPTSTNLVPYSENFEGGSWTNESIGTTPTLEGGYTAPDGSNSAYKISNANQDSFWYYPSVADSDDSRTIWARTVSGTGTAQLTSHNSNTNNTFNLTETWQRFEVNGTTSGTGSTSFYAVDFRGSGTLTELLVWGAQLEALSYATSYIPTLTGSTVTRATETLTGSGNSTLINSTEGVLYAEIAALADDGTYRELGLSDGTTSNRVLISFINSTNQIRANFNGTGGDNLFYTVTDIKDFHKVAVKWKANDFALWVDGVERDTDTSGSSFSSNTLNSLKFNSGVSGDKFYGKCKALAVFNEALSDTELTNLTS